MSKIPYDPNYLCFITTVTHQRRPLFRDVRLAERLGTMIRMACQSKGFVPLAYAILPDHVHLLVCERAQYFNVDLAIPERALERTRSAGGNTTAQENNPIPVEGGFSKPPSFTVAELMQSIKGTFSRTIHQGRIWQPGYFCWYVHDARDASRVTNYIIYNYRGSNLSDIFSREPYVWIDHDRLAYLLS